jgi:hypothetical protein
MDAGTPSQGNNQRTIIIIVVVALVLLCCCCAAIGLVGWFYGDQIVEQLGLSRALPALAMM